MYGLAPLVATVARVDPKTGEKINKLRKSYEGQLKTLLLAGKNKAIKHKDGLNLLHIVNYPAEEWYSHKTAGKEVMHGLPTSTRANLEKAMKFEPGRVPTHEEWESALGIEKLKNAEKKPNGVKVNGTVKEDRPKRVNKKRRYNDDSFEGYGEGFEDDRDDSSDGQSNSLRKKRRKVWRMEIVDHC